MSEPYPTIASVIALLLAAANFLWTQFKEIAGLKERLAVVEAKCKTIETLEDVSKRLASMETKMELFWKFVQEKLTDVLMHPNTPRMDSLLLKLKNGAPMALNQLNELKGYLEREMRKLKECNDPRVIAAAFVLQRVEQLISDSPPESKV